MEHKDIVKPVQVRRVPRAQQMPGARGHRETFFQRELATLVCVKALVSEPGENNFL